MGKRIESKINYPIPLHLQPAALYLGYKKGDFPITDIHTKKIITFPCDQHLTLNEMKYVVNCVKNFYEYKK